MAVRKPESSVDLLAKLIDSPDEFRERLQELRAAIAASEDASAQAEADRQAADDRRAALEQAMDFYRSELKKAADELGPQVAAVTAREAAVRKLEQELSARETAVAAKEQAIAHALEPVRGAE